MSHVQAWCFFDAPVTLDALRSALAAYEPTADLPFRVDGDALVADEVDGLRIRIAPSDASAASAALGRTWPASVVMDVRYDAAADRPADNDLVATGAFCGSVGETPWFVLVTCEAVNIGFPGVTVVDRYVGTYPKD